MTLRALTWGLGGLAAGFAAAGLAALGDGSPAVTGPAAAQAGVGLAAAGAWLLACLGAGAAALERLEPSLLEDGRGVVHSLVAGLLLWSLLGLGLAALGQLHTPGILACAALLGAGWLRRPRLVLPRLPPLVPWALALIAIPGVVDALAPAITTDELYYHLAIPDALLREGGLVGGFLRPSGSRPLALHLPVAMVLATGGASAAKLLHLGMCLTLVGGVGVVAGRLGGDRAGGVAALLLAGSFNVLHDAGVVANNIPTALAVLALLDAALRGRVTAMAVLAGAALSLKYTAAAPVTACFLIARTSWRGRIAAGAAALALLAPWWARNLIEGLHPLFPFAGWPGDLPFQYLEKYGAGRDLAAMLALPYNVVATAELHSNRFLGRLSPAWLLALPAALAVGLTGPLGRRLAAASLLTWLGWAAGPHWIRYLLPGMPILAIAGAVGMAKAAERAGGCSAGAVWAGVAVAWLAGLPANVGPVWTRTADRLPAALGTESADDYYARTYAPWTAVSWMNRHLPEGAKVACLFDWSSYLVDRPVVLGSVEDHVPSRHFLLQHGDRSLEALRAAGVTHVLVRKARFLRKLYPFLDEARLEADFDAPVALLDELLLMDATLVFAEGGSRVYRLDARPADAGVETP